MPQYTLAQLAEKLGATLQGGDPDMVINSLAPLAEANSGQLSFLTDPKYKKYLATTGASAVLLLKEHAKDCPVPALIVDNPAVVFITLAGLFERKASFKPGVHSTALVGEQCDIAPTVAIAAQSVIGDRVSIGAGTVIYPGVVVGDDVSIGENCIIYANVSVYQGSQLGDNVIVHSGAVIGSDGFGNVNQDGKWTKTPQLGRTVIHNNVEIGANTTIDCGAIGDTVISEGVKLDNGIQVAHNVHIGPHTAIAGHSAIAGSTRIGARCMIAGKVAINGHIEICDDVVVLATTSVSKSIKTPGIYSALLPVREHHYWNKRFAKLNKIDDLLARTKKLETLLNEVGEHELN